MNKANRKIDNLLLSCKKVLQSFEVQGYDNLVFSASYYRNGKKLNSIDKADTQYFSKLIRNYEKTENPDKIKVEILNSDTLLWSKEFNVSEAVIEPVNVHNFQGFGEAEINEIVGRKISDYQKIKENEDLREQLEIFTEENRELRGDLEEAAAQLEAKRQMEYYANLLGMAMPAIAKALGKSPAGQALGFLSGIEEETTGVQPESTTPDTGNTIIQMVKEYMQGLDNTTLGKLYLVMCEFSSNNQNIDRALHCLTQKNTSHD